MNGILNLAMYVAVSVTMILLGAALSGVALVQIWLDNMQDLRSFCWCMLYYVSGYVAMRTSTDLGELFLEKEDEDET